MWWNETLGPWDKTNQEQSIHCLNAQCPGTCVMSQRHCEAAQDCSKPLQNLRGQRRAQVQREHAWNGKDGQWLSCKSRKASKPQSEADDPAHHMGTVLKMEGSQKKPEECWEFQFPLDLNHLIKPEICSAFQTLSSGLQHYARWHQMIKHVQTKSLLSSAPCCLWESPKPADITHLILSALVLQVYLFPRVMKYLLIPEKYYAV